MPPGGVDGAEELRPCMPSSHDLIVIGASAGGLRALTKLAASWPIDMPAAILVVLHLWAEGPSYLPEILSHAGPLHAMHPNDGDPLCYGRIYVARPDCHLLVGRGVVRVIHGPKENRHRPAIDPLFRSAATIYGPRVVACVLTGLLDDGTAGALAVRRLGGTIIVQDPADALHPSMPASVLENMVPDHVLPLDEIPKKLVELAGKPAVAAGANFAVEDEKEVKVAEVDMEAIEDLDRRGHPSVFACPECNGVLWEIQDGKLLRFRCRVGHAYTADSLSAEQAQRVDEAIWAAFRALEETIELHRRMSLEARKRGKSHLADEHQKAALKGEQSAQTLRDLVLTSQPVVAQHS